MPEGDQTDLLSPVSELSLLQLPLADIHDDLAGKVGRFRQLSDLSAALGLYGTTLPGGETTLAAWTEARTSFVHGNYVATVMLCQGLAEHMWRRISRLDWMGPSCPNEFRSSRQQAESHLFGDASFAIGVAIRLLALPAFRIDE